MIYSVKRKVKMKKNSLNMLKKEFPSDFRQIRYFTLLIVQSAPTEIKELNLLEQQISEVIKNAVKHGVKILYLPCSVKEDYLEITDYILM